MIQCRRVCIDCACEGGSIYICLMHKSLFVSVGASKVCFCKFHVIQHFHSSIDGKQCFSAVSRELNRAVLGDLYITT